MLQIKTDTSACQSPAFMWQNPIFPISVIQKGNTFHALLIAMRSISWIHTIETFPSYSFSEAISSSGVTFWSLYWKLDKIHKWINAF